MFVILIYSAFQVNATPVILVLGDSLSAGFGIQQDQQWVNLLADRLKKDQSDYLVVNTSVVGITSADGLRLLPQLLNDYTPQIVIIALGSNDGLRGNPVFTLKQNLSKMIDLAKAKNSKVLLIGFKMPVNYGNRYRSQFEAVYTDLSKETKVSLVPFLLAGFAEDLSYFQADHLHPTAKAQPLMLSNVWKYLEPML